MKINIQTLSEICQVNYAIKQALKRYINANLDNKKSTLKVIPCKFNLEEDFESEDDFIDQELYGENHIDIRNIDYSGDDGDICYSVYGEFEGEEFEYSFFTSFEQLRPYINEKFL